MIKFLHYTIKSKIKSYPLSKSKEFDSRSNNTMIKLHKSKDIMKTKSKILIKLMPILSVSILNSVKL